MAQSLLYAGLLFSLAARLASATGRCEDVAGYTDQLGLGCVDWASTADTKINCSDLATAALLGYNASAPGGPADVMINCPVSCGVCQPNPWVSIDDQGKVIKIQLSITGVDFTGVTNVSGAIQAAIGAGLNINATDATEFVLNVTTAGRRLGTAYVVSCMAVVPPSSTTRNMLQNAGLFGDATSTIVSAFSAKLTALGATVTALAITLPQPPIAQSVKVMRNSLTAVVLGIYGVSVPTTTWCQDDPTFIDELKEDCSGWVGYDCTNTDRWTGSERPYTDAGLIRAQKWCPLSCGFCSPPSRMTSSDLYATCQDDPLLINFCARFRGLNCAWAKEMGFPQAYEDKLLSRCPLSCGTCVPAAGPPSCADTPGWKDAKGRSCSQWSAMDCGLEVAGYTRAEIMQVQINCPMSCKFCDPAMSGSFAPATTEPGYWGKLGNETGIKHTTCQDDPSYSYIKLYGCPDFIGKLCTIGSLYLEQRWLIGPRGAGVGPWGAWRWHKPLWQSCPVSCGHCSPPNRVLPVDNFIECDDDQYFGDWCAYRWDNQNCSTWQDRINVALPEEVQLYNTTIFKSCPKSCKLCSPPPCGPGTRRDKVHHRCVGCTLGTFASTTRAGPAAMTCEEALPGDYVDTENAVGYQRCLPGYYNPDKAGTRCYSCPPGKYSDQYSASECTSCDLGWFQDQWNSTSCIRCAQGTYGNETELTECFGCPVERTTFYLSATNITDCACPAGTWQEPGRSLDVCTACPGGMRCPGMHRYMDDSPDTTGILMAGFMSLPSDPYVVYSCMKGNRTCPEERPIPLTDEDVSTTVCAGGRIGVRCAKCPDSTYVKDSECEDCGDFARKDASWKAIIALLVQLGCTFWAYRKEGKEQSAAWMMVMAFLSFVQVLQALSSVPLAWPTELADFFHVINIISIPGFFEFFEFRHDCIFGTDALSKILRDALIPLIPFCNFLILYPISLCFGRKLKFTTMCSAIAAAFTAFFVTITGMAVQMFPSDPMPPPNMKKFVRGLPAVELYSHEWWQCMPVTMAAVLVYCGGTFVYVGRAVIMAPKKVATDEDWAEQYDFMLKDINPSAWWWITITLVYALAIQLVQAISDDVFVQLYMSMLFITVMVLVEIAVQPNVFVSVNNVEITLYVANLVFLIFATAFIREEDLEKQDHNLHAVVMLAALALVVAFTVASIVYWVRNAFKATPLGKAAHVAFRGRDIMTLLAQMPEAEFLGRAGQMLESDRLLLKRATDMLVAVFFGEQPTTKLFRQRVMPGTEYKVWDPASTASEALRQVHSREAHDSLEDSAKLRAQVKVLAGELRHHHIGPLTMEKRIHHQRVIALRRQESKSRRERLRAAGMGVPGAATIGHMVKQFASIFLDPEKGSRMELEEFLEEAKEFSKLSTDDLTRIFTVFDIGEKGEVGIHDFFHLVASMAPANTDAFGDDTDNLWEEQTKEQEQAYEEAEEAALEKEEELEEEEGGEDEELPPGWAEETDEHGVKWYVNEEAKKRQKRRPRAGDQAPPRPADSTEVHDITDEYGAGETHLTTI